MLKGIIYVAIAIGIGVTLTVLVDHATGYTATGTAATTIHDLLQLLKGAVYGTIIWRYMIQA